MALLSQTMLNPDRAEFGSQPPLASENARRNGHIPHWARVPAFALRTSLAILTAACGSSEAQPPSSPSGSEVKSGSEISSEISLEYPFSGLWYLTTGPHFDGLTGGIRAALDFAPPERVDCPGGNPLVKRFVEEKRFVEASASGKVAVVGNEKDPTDKNHSIVEIDHGQGWRTGYMHLANMLVNVGQEVKQGERLGNPSCEVSPGGSTSGIHLHWYAKKDGKWIPANEIVLSKGSVEAGVNNKEGTLIPPDGLVRTADTRRCGPDENSIKACGGIRNDLSKEVILGPNLVPNPSFESGTSLPTNWPLWAPGSLPPLGSAGWRWETGIAHTGRRSISCVSDVKDPIAIGLSMTGFIPVDPLKTYRLEFWAKNPPKETGGATIIAYGFDSSGKGLPGQGTGPSVGTDKEGWKLYSGYSGDIQFLPPNLSTTSKVQLHISCSTADNAPVYIDDVSFAQILEPPPTPRPTFTPTPIPEVSASLKAAELLSQKSQKEIYETILRTPITRDDLPQGWVQRVSPLFLSEAQAEGPHGRHYGAGISIYEEPYSSGNSTISFRIFESSAQAQAVLKEYQSSNTRLISGVGDMALFGLYSPNGGYSLVAVDKVLISVNGGVRHGDEHALLDLANSAVRYLIGVGEAGSSNSVPWRWFIGVSVLGAAGLASYWGYERWKLRRGVGAGVTAGAGASTSSTGVPFRIGGTIGAIGGPSNPNTAPSTGPTQPKNPEWISGQQDFAKRWQAAQSKLLPIQPGETGNEQDHILDRFKAGMGIIHELSLDDAVKVPVMAKRVRAGIEYLIPEIWSNNRIFKRFFDPGFNAGFLPPENLAKILYLPEKYRSVSSFTSEQRKDIRRIRSVLMFALHPDTFQADSDQSLQDSIDDLLKKLNPAWSYIDRLIK